MLTPGKLARHLDQTRQGPNDLAPTRTADSPATAFQRRAATGFGWVSIGLGVFQTCLPKRFARVIGSPENPTGIRAIGMREITAGLGLMTQRPPTPWFWVRVGGDLMDLALLTRASRSRKADNRKITRTMIATTAITAADLAAAILITRMTAQRLLQVRQSIAINRTPEEIYQFWHDYPQLATIMPHLHGVRVIAPDTTIWEAEGPLGSTVGWQAQTVDDRTNQSISWRSIGPSLVPTSGTVRFTKAPGDHGTFVTVALDYRPPLGIFGAGIAKLFAHAPEQMIHYDLLRLKQWLETGELTRTEGQPAGRKSSLSPRFDRPIQR